jgi:hypothetical protein
MTTTDPLGLHPLGIRGNHDFVILPSASHTKYFEAGPLQIGVEYRVLKSVEMLELFKDNPVVTEIYQNAGDVDFGGLSLHVIDRASGVERLRFDCFPDDPHYHYLVPEEGYELTVVYDPHANGDMLPWALGRLKDLRILKDMLTHAGASELAASIDEDKLVGVMSDVEEATRVATRPQSIDMSSISVAGSKRSGES